MKAHEIEDVDTGKIIGWKYGSRPGGVISDMSDKNLVVGLMVKHQNSDVFYLKADKPHHTGKALHGHRLAIDSRPSKRV